MQAADLRLAYDGDRAAVYMGEALDALRLLPGSSVHLVLADPPYGMSRQTTEDIRQCLAAWAIGKTYVPRARGGFDGQEWDAWPPGPEFWAECLRVLKPGGHLLCFAAGRTMDLMMLGIRLGGFELRDAIGCGNGAPLLAWTHRTGFPKSLDVAKGIDRHLGVAPTIVGRERVNHDIRGGAYVGGSGDPYERDVTVPTSDEAKAWEGWGTGLKPAWEPVVVARRPLDGTVAENVLRHGCGALNLDACRIDGRWPSNLLMDALPSAAIHCAKASADERDGCDHPTVKPLHLMQYLIRLACPANGIVVDPFTGSGTTVEAALLEGVHVVGVERDPRWLPAIVRRIARAGAAHPEVAPPTPAPVTARLPASAPADCTDKGALSVSRATADALAELRGVMKSTNAEVMAAALDAMARAPSPPT